MGCIQMVVTISVVTKNMHMSRRWKAEVVAYRICIQPSPRLTHLMPLKPDRLPVCLVYQVFSTLSRLQKPAAIEPCIGISRMSNQRKAEFVNGNFCIQSF
jgi:hypothetical protein